MQKICRRQISAHAVERTLRSVHEAYGKEVKIQLAIFTGIDISLSRVSLYVRYPFL
jgi:hypothetical protein